MDSERLQPSLSEVLSLAEKQHGVVTRAQLVAMGLQDQSIQHRLRTGRLHRVRRGVYAVGRPHLERPGFWMAAVLSCGPEAGLSHGTAAALWRMRPESVGVIEVSVPSRRSPRPAGVVVHRRQGLSAEDFTQHAGIPVTTPVRTLVDLATRLSRNQLEAAVNEADKRDLTDPETLRLALTEMTGPGVAILRATLDRQVFTLTDSELERRFLPIARRAGLPKPETGQHLNGFKVDFYWPDLKLVVETDSLRYHRTPAQQARDRLRDQAHAAAGLATLRFTHSQVTFRPQHVEATLGAVARRLRAADGRYPVPRTRP